MVALTAFPAPPSFGQESLKCGQSKRTRRPTAAGSGATSAAADVSVERRAFATMTFRRRKPANRGDAGK